MKKTIIISIIALALPVLALAQEKTYYVPKKGDWSVGVTFNAASLGHKLSMQPKPGDFAGQFIEDLASNPKQMFILSQDPVAAFRVKYQMSSKTAFRASLGVN